MRMIRVFVLNDNNEPTHKFDIVYVQESIEFDGYQRIIDVPTFINLDGDILAAN